MPKPRVSVVVATYNYAPFLTACIDSVLAQDFDELVVVDDGSTDDTPAVLGAYSDERLRVIRQSNAGQAGALNVACEAATGDYIAFLDGDDVFLPGKARAIRDQLARTPDVGLIYHPFALLEQDSGQLTLQSLRAISGDLRLDRKRLLRFPGQATSGLIVSRELLQQLLPIPSGLRFMADGWIVYLAPLYGSVVAMPGHHSLYRLHGANAFNFRHADEEARRKKLTMQEELEARLRDRITTLDLPPRWARQLLRPHELFTWQMRMALTESPSRIERARFEAASVVPIIRTGGSWRQILGCVARALGLRRLGRPRSG